MTINLKGQPLVAAVLALGVAGLAIAGYLTYVHYNEDALVCTTGGCETVQQSEYATIAGIPIALLGVLMFGAIIALAAARLSANPPVAFDIATIASWLMVFAATLYYIYLTYVEIFVLEAICQWCVASSVVTLGILTVESVHLWRILDLGGEDDDLLPSTGRAITRR